MLGKKCLYEEIYGISRDFIKNCCVARYAGKIVRKAARDEISMRILRR